MSHYSRAYEEGFDAGSHDSNYRIAQLEKQLAAKQAQIDELMLEFCSERMTVEQLAEWAMHQGPVSKEEFERLKQEATK